MRSYRKASGAWTALVIAGGGGALLIASLLAVPAAPAQEQEKTETFTGAVGDAMCGAKHMGGDAKQCTIGCVKNMGSKYALLVGDKVYTLEGKEADLEKLAGAKATVTGTANGTTIKVSAVAAAK